MSKISQFIKQNDLRPGDAIKAKKVGWEILDHYAVYVGKNQFGIHYFMANSMTDGVRYYSELEVESLLKSFTPRQIRLFRGKEMERNAAVQRAVREEGKRYSLLNYNCEHFCNLVQSGSKYSTQVANLGIGILATFLIVGISKSI